MGLGSGAAPGHIMFVAVFLVFFVDTSQTSVFMIRRVICQFTNY